MSTAPSQPLVSYIAHAAPATRRPASGNEPFLRPEVGFTPKWFKDALDIEFGERWHTDPAFRRETIAAMSTETRKRFGTRTDLGILQHPDEPVDVLTGTYGALLVPGIYGVPLQFQDVDWPWSQPGQFLDDRAADTLEPPDLEDNPFWEQFMSQLDWIDHHVGRLEGFMNWQSVVNNSYRLRGEELFIDMILEPNRVKHVFDCVSETMIDGMRRLYARQKKSGVELTHCTISNCMVNLLSPEHYQELVLPHDRKLAEAFATVGVHNCAWNADAYVPHYATLPGVGYIDMGLESDLVEAKRAFPKARRALMYTPMDVREKPVETIEQDLDRFAREYGPCDLVLADIESGTSDQRILDIFDLCERLSDKYGDARE
ncbi:MAG: hypothetical protein BMS9Abin37_2333 [Acidobacteriota bacterium]|nr:MAG: hypothetical protein BMS9Abin37_2333 [Acidobacteriota bacterium]